MKLKLKNSLLGKLLMILLSSLHLGCEKSDGFLFTLNYFSTGKSRNYPVFIHCADSCIVYEFKNDSVLKFVVKDKSVYKKISNLILSKRIRSDSTMSYWPSDVPFIFINFENRRHKVIIRDSEGKYVKLSRDLIGLMYSQDLLLINKKYYLFDAKNFENFPKILEYDNIMAPNLEIDSLY